MNAVLHHVAEQQGGVFTRLQALQSGYTSQQVHDHHRHGRWHRLRRGVYVEAARWEQLDDQGQHVLHIRAVSLACLDDLVFSHTSAAALHSLPLWEVPRTPVTAIRQRPASSRLEAGVHHFLAPLPPTHITSVDGLCATSAERTMVDLARSLPFESAVVACDAALRAGADRSVALEIFDECARWPGGPQALPVLQFADPLAESVGESRFRVLCHTMGLPKPALQVPIYGRHGRFLGRGDLLFEEQRTLAEFDGRVKYGGYDKDASDVVFAEKRREDAIREEAGLEVVRFIWADLYHPRLLVERLYAAFARAALRLAA